MICGDFFTDPTILPCSHTFCKQCIINNLQKHKIKKIACCPICCELLSQDDIKSFPVNLNVIKLVEAFKNETATKCGNCEKEDSLVVWCIDCCNLYCQNCNEIHRNWKDFKPHRVIKIESSSETCNIHFKTKDLYCKTCRSIICQACTLKYHPFETHDFEPIDMVTSKEKENIKQAAVSLEYLLKEMRCNAKKLEEFEDLVDSKNEEYIKQIKCTFRKKHESLTESEEKLLKNIDSNKVLLKQMLAMQKTNAALLEIKLEGCKGFTEKVMAANRTQQVLLYNQWIIKQVNNLTEQVKTEQVRNGKFDLQSHEHISKVFSDKYDIFTSPLCFVEGLLRLPHCNIHVCTPLVKPKQVKLIVTLKDDLGYPVVYQSSNIKMYCNVKGELLQNVHVKEQPYPHGVYHINYSVKKKIDHLVLVYWKNILLNHQKIKVSVNARDYININKQEVKIIKYGLPTTPLKFPYSLAKGPNNLLIFSDDSTSQLVVFNDQLQYSCCIGRRGKRNGEFQNITGIAVDSDKYLYVTDSDLHCIQKFNLDRKFSCKFGKYGSENNQFKSPHGLLICYPKLFVCDRYNHRIQVFIRETWYYTIGQQGTEPGSFKEPIDLSLNNSKDQIFVTDNKNHRVQVFTLNGQFLRVFGNLTDISSTLQKNPVGIFVTPDGYVLITFYHTSCIMVLDEDGTFISVIESSYQGKERFNHPCGIVMMNNGQIIIACDLSNKLVVL